MEPCPICQLSTADQNELTIHLMTSHRKSEIVSDYLTDRGHDEAEQRSEQSVPLHQNT